MTDQELLCKWAEQRYANKLIAPVLRVELEDIHDPGWSEYTPGDGDGVGVSVFIDAGKQCAVYREYFSSEMVDLIRDICQFAAARV